MHAALQTDADERRHESREQLYLDGSIVFHNGEMKLDCLIPDWSAIGARLVVSDADDVPDRFVLVIDRLGWRTDATVTRRERGLIGVSFANVNG